MLRDREASMSNRGSLSSNQSSDDNLRSEKNKCNYPLLLLLISK